MDKFTVKQLQRIRLKAYCNQDYAKDFELSHALNDLAVAAETVRQLIVHPEMRLDR